METKPGVFTTEFWIMFLLQVILTLNTLNIWRYLPERFAWVSVLAQALLAGLYAVGRGVAKNGKSFDPAAKNNYTLFPKAKNATKRLS